MVNVERRYYTARIEGTIITCLWLLAIVEKVRRNER